MNDHLLLPFFSPETLENFYAAETDDESAERCPL